MNFKQTAQGIDYAAPENIGKCPGYKTSWKLVRRSAQLLFAQSPDAYECIHETVEALGRIQNDVDAPTYLPYMREALSCIADYHLPKNDWSAAQNAVRGVLVNLVEEMAANVASKITNPAYDDFPSAKADSNFGHVFEVAATRTEDGQMILQDDLEKMGFSKDFVLVWESAHTSCNHAEETDNMPWREPRYYRDANQRLIDLLQISELPMELDVEGIAA